MMTKTQKVILKIGLLCFMLMICCIPTMTTYAETIADQVAQSVAFREYDTVELRYEEATTLKIVLEENGTFELDFSPITVWSLSAQLYDEESNLLGEVGSRYFTCLSSSDFYKGDLNAGTYYLRLWINSQSSIGTYTYFARQIPTESANLEICINLKKGKSIQLGTIFNNSNDKNIKWSSSSTKIATVSSNGVVKALKKGTTTIKAYNSSGLVSKLKIKVV